MISNLSAVDMKEGRKNRHQRVMGKQRIGVPVAAVAGFACLLAGELTAQTQPNAATVRALTEADRDRAASSAREMREYKERVSLQSRPPGSTEKPKIVTGYGSLEQNIKVDRSKIYTAPRSNPVTTGPPEKKKRGFGLFGKKDRNRRDPPASSAPDTDVAVVEPLDDVPEPEPPVAVSESSRASTGRIPPPPGFSEPSPVIPPPASEPVTETPAVPETVSNAPMPVEDPVAVVRPATAPAASSGPTTGPAPQRAKEDRGLIGGLFSAITPGSRNDEVSAATMAGAGSSKEKKGLFGRIFGRDDRPPAAAAPAAPPPAPAIPPPEIPPPGTTAPAPEPSADIPIPGAPASPPTPIRPGSLAGTTGSEPAPPPVSPNAGRSSLVIPPGGAVRPPSPAEPTAVSAYSGTPAPVITPLAAPSPAVVPKPAAPISTPSSGAHFLVVKAEAGAPMQDSAGSAIRALRPGDVVQFLKAAGTFARVRLPDGSEGFVATGSLRDATFGEAAQFYARGGTEAE